MTDDEFDEFTTIGEPDPDNVLIGFTPNMFAIKYPDGTFRYLYLTAVPPL